ncbi:family 20 glycosylhydrolase [Marinimicrobium agarilyticum]|uniref:family 20 glycosylhydrolase n=1 Tax=Marinimicrobium agarilyticum TaxID=306546 RepID=UPI00040F77C9|nr:family 20 glycosylhydrolase [Marinimicrobium agarilyticum]
MPQNKKTLFSLLLLGLLAGSPAHAAAPEWPLMPYPASIEIAEGELVLSDTFQLTLADGAAEALPEPVLASFTQRLQRQTGMNVERIEGEGHHHGAHGTHHASSHGQTPTEGATPLMIHIEQGAPRFRTSTELQPQVEGYQIHVVDSGIHIQATTQLGAGHALETLLQLLGEGDTDTLPVMCIDDQPRFGWRGLMLDSVRHFFSVETIKRQLDGMAAAKLNIFHWHLTDDQGWRLESRAYPKLHQNASNGQYYTWEQVGEVVNYAADRGIQVMPEIDMPGHSSAIAVAYPQLMSSDGPFHPEDRWGVHQALLNPANPAVYEFAEAILTEVAALFPFDYIHIGGDEVDPAHWHQNNEIQAFMREQDLADAGDLHAYFNQRLSAILGQLDRKMMGWDEVLHPALPKTTAVQSWRGPDALAQAAAAGHPAVLSTGFYLDQPQPAGYHYRNRLFPEPLSMEATASADEQWESWTFEFPRKRGSAVRGTFTLIEGPANQRRGFIDFAGKSRQALDRLRLIDDRITFELDTWMGPVRARLKRSDAVLSGDMVVGNAAYPVTGKRKAHSGQTGAQIPEAIAKPELSDADRARILGGEIALWAELIDENSIDHRLWPRGFVVAERLWSPVERRDLDPLYQRLPAVSDWAASSVGLRHQAQTRQALERLFPVSQRPSVEVLLEAIEPAQYYHRHHEKSVNETYSRRDPLNRLVDALPAESLAVRTLSQQIDQWLAAPNDTEHARAIRTTLTRWRDAAQQLLQQLPFDGDQAIENQAEQVLTVAEWGLVLSDHWEQHKGLSHGLRSAAQQALRRAQRIDEEMVVAAAYPIEQLLNAVPEPAQTRDWMPDGSFTSGIEGPAVGPDGHLYAVNFKRQGTIGRVTAQGEGEVFAALPEGSTANSIRFDSAGQLWLADYTGHTLIRLHHQTGEVLAIHHNPDMHQPNDIAVTRWGAIFASDPNWADSTGQLWRMDPDGTFTRLEADMGTTNGIELSPDQRRLYVNESAQRRVWVYDVSARGALSNKRLFFEFDDYGLDGMATDPEGNLYIARYGAGEIAVLSPRGQLIDRIQLKGRYPTNIALDLGDQPRAYVTLQQRGAVEVFNLAP